MNKLKQFRGLLPVCMTSLCVVEPAGAVMGDSQAVFTVPQIHRPSYLQAIRDPVFGTRVIRIADDTGRPIT